ncbi:hypothetical protein SCACP_09970 [Sporomusa carbonis]|uniref:hypothetical protein n=1 Tax=Sporomusa carbonis TaxID=3076075 RepID=UPI003A5FFF34
MYENKPDWQHSSHNLSLSPNSDIDQHKKLNAAGCPDEQAPATIKQIIIKELQTLIQNYIDYCKHVEL